MYGSSKIYTLIFSILLVVGCTNNPVFEPQKHQIKNSTKWLVDKDSEKKIAKSLYKEFDRSGKLILLEEFDSVGKIQSRKVITYAKNKKIEDITIYNKNNTQVRSKNIYQLNSAGKVIMLISLNRNGDTLKITKYKYDTQGNIIEKKSYDKKGKLIDKLFFLYNYDNSGVVTGRSVSDNSNGNFMSRDSMIYRPDIRQVERIRYNSGGKKQISYTYTYDNAGNVRKEIHSDKNGIVIRKYIFEYTYF